MANRLAEASSPYLLQHADNPIDWWPWTPEAFDEARRRDVPILLSVGYAACHWCHVMAHESFSDPEVAALVNTNFVAIKVDREERPDVDAVFMKATQALTGQGGWPMTVFLTPQGRPFFAGTYYPPEPAHGLPSFTQLVTALAEAWTSRRDEVLTSADSIVAHLSDEFGVLPASGGLDVTQLYEEVSADFDPVHGGFGSAPKFPAPGLIDALLVTGEPASLDLAQRSLEAMLRGGIHDQVGGGFHRYSVDAGWVVPHFEKMLYDNALLLGSYTRAWCRTADHDRRLRLLFERAIRGIVDFLGRDLQLDGGGFAASLDADSCDIRGMVHEGIYYVWSPDLLTDALGESDADWACEVFHVTQRGTFEHGLSTLQLRGTPDWNRLDAVLDRLREVRSGRFAPARDDKLVAAWNGFAIDSLVNAGLVFGEQAWLELAERAAQASWRLMVDGELRRVGLDGVPSDASGMADDYGALALGYARLAGAIGDAVWLERAVALLETALQRFGADDGGFYDAPADGNGVPPFARARDTADNPTPSGTACLVAALRLVGLLADRSDFEPRADQAAATLRGVLQAAPRFAGWAFVDALIADQAAKRLAPAVAVLVTPDGTQPIELISAAARMAPAGTALVAGPAGTRGFAHHFDDRDARGGEPTAYVCRGKVCFAPATDVRSLRAALWKRV